MNSQQMNGSAILDPMLKSGQRPEQVFEKLYLATLSRRPTAEEAQRLKEFAAKGERSLKEAGADILWALMNSSEFALNH
jgi:hypothetical protein